MAFINLVRRFETAEKERIESQYLRGWNVLPTYNISSLPQLFIDDGTQASTIRLEAYTENVLQVGSSNTYVESVLYPDTRCFNVAETQISPTYDSASGSYVWDNLTQDANICMDLETGAALNYFVPPVWHGMTVKVLLYGKTPLCYLSYDAEITDFNENGETAEKRYDNIQNAALENFDKSIQYPIESYINIDLQKMLLIQDTDTATINFYCNAEDEQLPTKADVCICNYLTAEYAFITDEPCSISWSDGEGTMLVPKGNNADTLRNSFLTAIKDTDNTYFIGIMFPEWYPMTYRDYEQQQV